MSTRLLERLAAAAAASPGAEICGLLFGSFGRIADARHCANVAADPRRRFEIDPAALIAAHRAERAGGGRIAGCFHSHPGGSAVPSASDAALAAADGAVWLIVGGGGEVRAWRAVAAGAVHGRFDPVALVATD